MSIESRTESLFLKCKSIGSPDFISHAGMDAALHDLVGQFAYKRSLDISNVRPELRELAKKFSESGVVCVHTLPKKVKELLSLRAGSSGIDTSAAVSVLKSLGFVPSQEFRERDNFIAILEGYGFVSIEGAEKSGKEPSKVYGYCIKKRDSSLFNAIGDIGKNFEGTINFSAGVQELGFMPRLRWHSEKTILETLQKVWPYSLVKDAYEQNNPSLLKSWDEFKDMHGQVYCAIQNAVHKKKNKERRQKKTGQSAGQGKKHAHISAISPQDRVNGLYPDFPDLFNFARYSVNSVDRKMLRQHITTAIRLGKNVSPHALDRTKDSGLKKIRSELRRIAIDEGLTVQQAICKVTGLRPESFATTGEQKNILGEISELATRVMLLSTQLIDSTGKFYENGFDKYFPQIHTVRPLLKKRVRLTREDGSFINPDFLIENESQCSILEVRAGAKSNNALDLISKFRSRSFVECKDYALRIIALLQMPSGVVSQTAPYLEDEKITVLDGKTFIDYFSKAMRELERSPYRALVANAVPNRRHSLANLVELQRRIIEEPHVIITPAHDALIQNHISVLGALASCLEKATEKQELTEKQEPKYSQIESVLRNYCSNGRICICEGRRYFNMRTPLSHVSVENRIIPTARYVIDNLECWKNHDLRTPENNDFFIPLDDAIFLDVENTGFKKNAPIFLVSTGYYDSKKNDFICESFFARDNYEEEAILRALNKKEKKYIVSFNGASFDLPRLTHRLESFIIPCIWARTSHLDVLTALAPFARQAGLPDRRLVTLEKVMFGFERPKDDIAGKDIPYAYWNYCRGGNPAPLGMVLRHNIFDVATTAACYVFLLKNPGFFNRNCLESFRIR